MRSMAGPTTTTSGRSFCRVADRRQARDIDRECRHATPAGRRRHQVGQGTLTLRCRRRAALAHAFGLSRRRRDAPPRRPRSLVSSVAGPITGVDRASSRRCGRRVPIPVTDDQAFDSGSNATSTRTSTSKGPMVRRLPSGTTLHGVSGAPGSTVAWPRAARRERASHRSAATGAPQIDDQRRNDPQLMGDTRASRLSALLRS